MVTQCKVMGWIGSQVQLTEPDKVLEVKQKEGNDHRRYLDSGFTNGRDGEYFPEKRDKLDEGGVKVDLNRSK